MHLADAARMMAGFFLETFAARAGMAFGLFHHLVAAMSFAAYAVAPLGWIATAFGKV